ncbi:protein JSN1 [Entomortierella parvispora]|uniref:Protein JSN1 n=1 Tax=Entomortierella parvispora TaxID=205924 RepID=A0A9P3H1W3_9FUNG|nr:protein JSN1 [Entomortierella parvispora]
MDLPSAMVQPGGHGLNHTQAHSERDHLVDSLNPANDPSSSNANNAMPIITTTSADMAMAIPSFAAARRARADTLPSMGARPSPFLHDHLHHSTSSSSLSTPTAAFSLGGKNPPGTQRPLRRTPSLLVPPQLSNRHRSGSLTLPSASISAAFGPSIFTSSWGDPGSPTGDRPATTPTTREMLFDSENENAIMSTLDALGLDDPVQSGSGGSHLLNSNDNNNTGSGHLQHHHHQQQQHHQHHRAASLSLGSGNSIGSIGGPGSVSSSLHAGGHRIGVDLRSRSASFASSALSHLDMGAGRGLPSPPSASASSMGQGNNNLVNRSNSLSNLNGHNTLPAIGGLNGLNKQGGGNTEIRLEKSLAHSLLMPNSVSFANRIRSYSVSATPAYQEVLEDEHEDDVGQLNASSPSSGSSGAIGTYPTTAGGVVQFQSFQQTHSRPRAISMGFLEIPNDIADEQRKFANAGPRSYSDMKARQTHQRTTSAGADMLADIVNGLSSVPGDKGQIQSGNTNTNATANNGGLGHSHSLSLGYNPQLGKQPQSTSQQQPPSSQLYSKPQRPGHQHSSSFSGRSLEDVAFGNLNGSGGMHEQGNGNSGSNHSLPNSGDLIQEHHDLGLSSAAAAVTQQIPTRSLWIGNVDPSFTTNDLMQVFSAFGPVESLKVIPDKECAFINFTRVEDAMRAKEDISERRGGRIGNATVRVGYGKAELMANADAPVLHPTRALWLGNIPASATPSSLHAVFSHFGNIESARVLTHKSCGFINFENMEDAVLAKKVMHGQEVFGPGTGAVRIGFAKVPAKQSPSDSPSPGHGDNLDMNGEIRMSNASTGRMTRREADAPTELDRMLALMTMATKSPPSYGHDQESAPVEDPAYERLAMLKEFSTDDDSDAQETLTPSSSEPVIYFSSIPPVAEPSPHRRLDAPRLREIRKRLDSGHCTVKELDSLSNECMDECVELCSDYIGNTVMQKLFERCSEPQKTKMLELIAPHLASIGVHKNGTWAAQKIIDCAKSPAQVELICKYVQPYTPPLLLDQFGNYVVQCCLRLGQARNGFIFEAMSDKFWEIAQGRFGARAMRASLESQHASKIQQKHVAVAVVQNALALATNPNGTLMLTWLLDNSQLPGRYRVLAPRLAPHMSLLATHKLASLTVLKVINQRQEPDASDTLINSIVHSSQDHVLAEILGDQVHGVSLIQKILASPNVEQQQKVVLAEKVKSTLSKSSSQNVQGCKRLLEEIQLLLGGESSSGSENAKLGSSKSGYSGSTDFNGSSPQYYMAMSASQQHHGLQAQSSDSSSLMDSNSLGINGEGQDAPASSPGAYSVQHHHPYFGMPTHNQLYGHYPGQIPSPYYGPGVAYMPQPMTTMGYQGMSMMPQTGFHPYGTMPPPGISAGGAHTGHLEGQSGENSSAASHFLQQQHHQQQLCQIQHHPQQQQQQQQLQHQHAQQHYSQPQQQQQHQFQ